MRIESKIIMAILFIFLLNACVSSRGHMMLTNYLDNGIGTLTYEDVVKKWRSADNIIEEEETFTAIWIREDESLPGYVGPPYQTPSIYGEKKTLLFDRKTRLLKSYSVEYY